MHLESVRIEQLRCLKQVAFQPCPRHNLFYGDNGSGKTSVLEALYLLGRGHSFRHSDNRRLIQDGSEYCLVRARLRDDAGHTLPVAIQKLQDGTRLRIGQERQGRLSDLARYCPVLVLEPGQHRLLEDGPVLRRRYLDWSVFHVEHTYLALWQRYSRALRQRNALLRRKQRAQLPAWTQEFGQAAELLHGHRAQIFAELQPYIAELMDTFFGATHQIDVAYRRGWPAQVELQDALQDQEAQDLDRGFTQSGPQRAEIRVKVAGHLARDTLSRGQQKLLITALLLGQARHFAERRGTHPLLLVDDLPSELGAAARGRLFDWLQAYPGQCFITTLEAQSIPLALRQQARMFHVKHGEVAAEA